MKAASLTGRAAVVSLALLFSFLVAWHLATRGTGSVQQMSPEYAKLMRANGFNIGGEPSGHIILSDYTTTGDGFIAALQVLSVIKRGGKPVSEVCHRFEPLPQVLKNVRYQKGKPLENAKVRSAIASAERKLGGGGRLIVRPSGTEPVIRVMGEGDDRTLVESVVDDVVEALTQAAA